MGEVSMNLYLISQDSNIGYDTFDSAVVVAETEDQARRVSPSNFYEWSDEHNSWMFRYNDGTRTPEKHSHDWVSDLTKIEVSLLDTALPSLKAEEVVCASFNAG